MPEKEGNTQAVSIKIFCQTMTSKISKVQRKCRYKESAVQRKMMVKSASTKKNDGTKKVPVQRKRRNKKCVGTKKVLVQRKCWYKESAGTKKVSVQRKCQTLSTRLYTLYTLAYNIGRTSVLFGCCPTPPSFAVD